MTAFALFANFAGKIKNFPTVKKLHKKVLTNSKKYDIIIIPKGKEVKKMITKVYIFEITPAIAEAISKIESSIPCFFEVDFVDYDCIEYTIRCRKEDFHFVERILALYI